MWFVGGDQVRDSSGSVLVRRRGNVDGRHQDGEQSGWQSGKHDVSSWRPRSPLYTYVDAAWIAIRTATSSDEPRRNERHRESPVGGATAEETRPQEKIRDDSHPRRVRTHTRFSISFSRFLNRFLAFFFISYNYYYEIYNFIITIGYSSSAIYLISGPSCQLKIAEFNFSFMIS